VDFNADGRLDPFLARSNDGGAQTGDATLNAGNDTLTFFNRGNEAVGNQRTVLFADFDGDGLTDALHPTSSFGTTHAWTELHRGTATGQFDQANSIDQAAPFPFWHGRVSAPGTPCDGEDWANAQFKGTVVRDFDGDNKPDIVLVAYPDAGFADPRCTSFDQQFKRLNSYRGVFLLRNVSTPGAIKFENVSATAIGPKANCNDASCNNYYAPLPMDFDRDGDLDLVIGGLYVSDTSDTPLFTVLRNDSTAGAMRFVDISGGSPGIAALNALPIAEKDKYRFSDGVSFDYDNDGWIDFAFTNRDDSGSDKDVGFVHLFRNLGNGSFMLIERATSAMHFYFERARL
jgi:hypothetical protein